MKIPVEWLKQYIATNKSAKELAESFTALGLMLDKPPVIYRNGNYETEVLDLEHRMDRSDWLSILGCARDLAAFEGAQVQMPDLYTKQGITPKPEQIVDIKVECPDIVRRFNTRVFRNIKVKPSPDWLKNRLESYGIPSINNIVDITNYVMVELGQPMHAQDLAKMTKQEIVIRRGREGECLTTLLGENINLDESCFVLTQNDVPTVLGGIVGGRATGIDDNTKDIILDAGNYDQTNIRKTSRKIKIMNETVSRYDKFLHPQLTEIAIQRATKLILDLAGGDYYENIDWYPSKTQEKTMRLRNKRLSMLSGQIFDQNEVCDILQKLGYTIMSKSQDDITLSVPYFRTDVEVEDDIVSDILRIKNYINIPTSIIDRAPPSQLNTANYNFSDKVRDLMVNMGCHEHITDPLVPYEIDNHKQIKLANAQSSEKNALRTGIDLTLKTIIANYKKHGITKGDIFEIGNIYTKSDAISMDHLCYDDITETPILHLISFDLSKNILETNKRVKSILSGLLKSIGLSGYLIKKIDNDHKIFLDSESIGTLKNNSFSINLDSLTKRTGKNTRIVSNPAYTKSDDISYVTGITEPIGDTRQQIMTSIENIIDIEIESIRMSDNEKNIILHIKHDIQDFGKSRENILEIIKSVDKQAVFKS